LTLEVLPALGTEFGAHTVLIHEDDAFLSRDVTDLCDRKTCYSGGDRLAGACGEKQFVVVAAVQGEVQFNFAGGLPDAGTGYDWGVNLRAHAALFANVAEIGGEAVAEIDHG